MVPVFLFCSKNPTLRQNRIDCHNLDHGRTALGNDKGLAFDGLVNQTRQMSFGFVNADSFHDGGGEVVNNDK